MTMNTQSSNRRWNHQADGGTPSGQIRVPDPTELSMQRHLVQP